MRADEGREETGGASGARIGGFSRRYGIATEEKTPATDKQRAEQAKKFAIEAAKLAANTRGQNVVVLDVSNLSPVTDYYVIATGTSARQMRTVCDEIAELAGQYQLSALSTCGYEGEQWILSDFVDVVVHVFSPDARQFYDLDNLWGDARKIEWQGQAEGKKQG